MKKLMIVCCVAAVLLTGCKDWIDISPKTEVKSKEFFKTEDGFKSALIGIYGRMTNDETYGKNLTYGFIEELVQRYDNYSSNMIPTDEERARIYDYKNFTDSKNMVNTIWEEMYKTIANINNLLEQLEENGDRVLTTPGYRTMIEGEAYALRAYHYFDLLRLWGPIYAADPTARAIPWRGAFNNEKVPLMAADKVIEKILDDLRQAELLLADDTMEFGRNIDDLFMGERRFRMNLYAVKALTARVHLYAGNKGKAADYARDVIENSGLELANDNRYDVSLSAEALFCLDMFNMEERVADYWKNTVGMDQERWISTDNIRNVFEYFTIGINDIRYKNTYGFIHGSNRFMCRKYLGSTVNYKNIVPMIRLGEMYLILAESVAPEDSYTHLNTLRNTRGISKSDNLGSLTDAERLGYLNKEYQKEYFAEGQWFYFLKRHNVQTFHRLPVEKMIYYTLPIPDDEVEFGDVTE